MSGPAQSQEKIPSGTKAGAGAAGAGSGTLLVLLANNLPDRSPWKSWLVILAPSLSIGVTILYAWARKTIEHYIDRRQLEKFVRDAKATLKEALENPNTSDEHRKQLRAELESLEILLVKSNIDRVRFLSKSSLEA